jgi:hypothetical protein
MHWKDASTPGPRTRALRVITADNVATITDLAHHRHPVWLLTFTGPDASGMTELVLKAEMGIDGGAHFAAVAELIHLVDARSRAEVLSEPEMSALNQIGWKGTPFLREKLHQDEIVFVKMNVKHRFGNLQKPDPGTQGNFTSDQIQILGAVLPLLPGNRRLWESLGEIVAVDLFVGNSDRIAPDADPWGLGATGRAVLPNAGNIFLKFNRHGELKKAVALDNYDPRADAAKFDRPLHPDWMLNFAPILRDEQKSAQFAGSVIEQVLDHAHQAGMTARLGEQEAAWFFMGLRNGVAKIRAYLVQRTGMHRQAPHPSIVARAQFLGWM